MSFISKGIIPSEDERDEEKIYSKKNQRFIIGEDIFGCLPEMPIQDCGKQLSKSQIGNFSILTLSVTKIKLSAVIFSQMLTFTLNKSYFMRICNVV